MNEWYITIHWQHHQREFSAYLSTKSASQCILHPSQLDRRPVCTLYVASHQFGHRLLRMPGNVHVVNATNRVLELRLVHRL